MGSEENKATLRRNFEEIWNDRNFSLIRDLVSPEYVGITAFGVMKGQDGYEQNVKRQTTNMPDLHYTVDEVVGEGDTVMAKVTMTGTATSGKIGDIDYSGKKITITHILVNKYDENARVKESTSFGNPLETLKQLGVPIPPEWGMG